MSAPIVTPHVSWLKRVGQVIGKVLGIVGHTAAPIAHIAAGVAGALMPQFAPEIAFADGLVTKIAKQALVTEALAAAAAGATSGPEKLAAVIANIGPELDAWVASAFPGSAQVSAVAKAGLVNAVVAIMNELKAPDAAVAP